MMIRSVMAVCALAGSFSLAVAQPGPMPMFSFDTNGDGVISEDEFNQARDQRMAARAAQGRPMYRSDNAPAFRDIDSNGDGTVTQQEMMAFHQARMQQRPMPMPPRGYGYPGGMMARPGANQPSFADMDANGDGCIDPTELNQFQQSRIGPMPGSAGGMPRRGWGYNSMPAYQQFDLNKDGNVSQEEFIEGRRQRIAQRANEGRMLRGMADMPSFEEIDTDQDGNISPQEFSAHQSSHMRMRHGQPTE